MLQVKDLVVKLSDLEIIKELSINIEKGEIVSIIGPNGSGKTTLLNTLAGIYKVYKGSIIFLGSEINDLKLHERVSKGLILVPEARNLFPEMSIYENLIAGAFLTKNKNKIKERLEIVYNIFPWMRSRSKQLAGTLSGGEQRMLTIARALMSEPKLLMLDEPSAGLAPKIVAEVYKIIKRLNEELNITILLVDQNIKKALEISSRFYILSNGRITYEGKPTEAIERDIIRKYFGLSQ
jgi:branched-chain amino acid transport system ATP-binding protein